MTWESLEEPSDQTEFSVWWEKNIEQNITADRAKRFAKAAWDCQQMKIEKLERILRNVKTDKDSDA